MIRGIHHTTVSTPDLERALEFWHGLLGFDLLSRGGWDAGNALVDGIIGLTGSASKKAMIGAGNTYIELIQYLHPPARPRDERMRACDHGFSHICVDVVDIHAEYERLRDAGMELNAPPQRAGGFLAVYGRDPDGNIVELQEVVGDDLPFPDGTEVHQ